MKTFMLLLVCIGTVVGEVQAQENPEVLLGKWKLDMSPQDLTDDNFAMMEIKSVKNNQMKGTFYRQGVKLQNGQLNTLTGTLYGALESGDNSGTYNTSFYFENGKLYGTTHAVDRGFLAVWVATRDD